jgi:hypothetical protein
MPIGCPIFVRSESRLEDRPVKAEERRDRIGCAIQSGNLELWIDLRTCAANGWSSVAPAQLFELNRGPSPLLDCPPMLPVTESIAMDRACAATKYGDSILFSPGIGPPAPGVPPRESRIECCCRLRRRIGDRKFSVRRSIPSREGPLHRHCRMVDLHIAISLFYSRDRPPFGARLP